MSRPGSRTAMLSRRAPEICANPMARRLELPLLGSKPRGRPITAPRNKVWWSEGGSNLLHLVFQASALPDEFPDHVQRAVGGN
jgi:hypothetical protein